MTSWRILAGICGLFPIIFTFSSMFLPESPRYLLVIGKTNEAIRVLSWLRSNDALNPSKRVLDEIDEVKLYVYLYGIYRLKKLDFVLLTDYSNMYIYQ